MRYRKLDSDGDMVFGNEQADFYRDVPEAPAQAIGTRLRLLVGEWFLDFTSGTPWQNSVLGKHDKATADAVVRDRILNTQGVVGIITYSSDINPDTREYSYQAEVETIYGTAVVTGPISEVT